MTAVALEMSKNHQEEIVEVRLPSKTKHLHAIRVLTRTLAESMGFERDDSEKTALAVEEALTNVIEHAYHGDEDRMMQVIYEMQGEKFRIRIVHSGDQIDASQLLKGDDLSHFYRQKKKGGLGILIMRRCMDEITYKSGPRKSECCMTKYLRK
jgi:serine/threonine-protein kinase RsbW